MWRLAFSIILFLLSLLVLFRAPTNFFWRVAVAVTEFPYVFIFASVAFFILCFWANKYKVTVLTINGVAIVLYLLPVIQAYQLGTDLPGKLSKAFPFQTSDAQLKHPFSFFKMLSGIGAKDIKPEIFTYKKLPGKDLNIDFYPAGSGQKSPCVIVVHGGSWSGGDSKQLPGLNSYLADKGYHVAAINYRLAPTYKSPAPVEDVKAVMNYLIANSAKLNIDTNNFVLLGRSAGAQIALCAAYIFHNPNIKGVISFYGPADMVWGAKIRGNPLVMNTGKVFDEYLGGSFDEMPQKYHEASSLEYITETSPPTLIIHGRHDALVAFTHSEHLDEKLSEHHVPHYFLDLPWATHGCDYNISGPSGQLSTFTIERFLNSVTKN